MRLHFIGDISELQDGIAVLAADFGFVPDPEGLRVQVIRHELPELRVEREQGQITLYYNRRIHFYRALGLLIESLRDGQESFSVSETPQFKTNGPMFDVSQGNAVMRPDTVKRFIRLMAIMGLDMFMLYTEDSYDVKEQAYFGYMRGRYTQDEIRDMDDYAYMFGIEMIPCIQTLSHLKDVLKWSAFADIRDDEETMLVGEPKTYEFIEQMIVAAASSVRTKRFHIGMDEAWKLGQGEYLKRNGYRSKFDLMNEHLHRVLEITRKHGLEPMMWSDMYFRAGSKTGAYYDKECVIPERVIAEMPKDVQIVYWDYYHTDEEFYEDWIRRHKSFGSTPIFAGGIWNWKGFVLNYGLTMRSTNAALNVCKREGVEEIIATLWGDDGTECDWFSAVLGLQLFAEHGYAAELSEEKLRKRFAFCTGGQFDDFMDIRWVDEIPGIAPDNVNNANPSRVMLWQHPMMGLFDSNLAGRGLERYYSQLEKKFETYASRGGEFRFVFEVLRKLCAVLTVKAELGVNLVEAYRSRELNTLKQYADDIIPGLIGKVRDLQAAHRDRWFEVNKAFGWEVIDYRYGALILSLETTVKRLADYVSGTTDRLEELEEARLPYHGKDGYLDCQWYQFIPTASRIAQP
ncbi:beta-N-acetylhexosaminidase [Paenibacillus mesophilus]|uniref:beta-N-acetylhexosaminidase n=1 Tax=Paenibacillus mesophilus TaxID=2582849 RepID=UPI00110D7235|nr:beta-N-acetylhexosaminidase [Paenibacillus mesophilus]TMV50142.1 beta-N-acetylhexosaminidase [Paenibacillus mesophilus]